MATIYQFESFKVWQKARMLCQKVFELIEAGKLKKDYGLIEQLNRSSGSVMDNIAEGFGRSGTNEFINFLSYSNASALETKSQLYRACDRKYINLIELEELVVLINEITKMLSSLMQYLNKTDIRGVKFKSRINKPREAMFNSATKNS